jgi:hypothetical protein
METSFDSGYDKYVKCVEQLLDSNDLSNFKNNPDYIYMLEHVSIKQGKEYYNLIKNEFNINDIIIKTYCNLNDSIGNPEIDTYSFGTASPSSLRYIYLSNLCLKYMKTLGKNTVNIAEIGGGYGGLALALEFFSEYYDIIIEQYDIIDINIITKLQEKYINKLTTYSPIFKFHDAATYGNNITSDNLFLISCYAFSEISLPHQEKYIQTMFYKVSNGFFVWNTNTIIDFRKKYTKEVERPLTGQYNEFLYF